MAWSQAVEIHHSRMSHLTIAVEDLHPGIAAVLVRGTFKSHTAAFERKLKTLRGFVATESYGLAFEPLERIGDQCIWILMQAVGQVALHGFRLKIPT